jgi:hypothetical protein
MCSWTGAAIAIIDWWVSAYCASTHPTAVVRSSLVGNSEALTIVISRQRREIFLL